MYYLIEFFNVSVQQEVMGWPSGIRAAFVRISERIVQYGPNLGLPYTRAMGEGLFEIRAQGREGLGRGLFCVTQDRRVVILHAFIKKTQRTPAKSLALARRRKNEVLS